MVDTGFFSQSPWGAAVYADLQGRHVEDFQYAVLIAIYEVPFPVRGSAQL